jgi:hypothetical protein
VGWCAPPPQRGGRAGPFTVAVTVAVHSRGYGHGRGHGVRAATQESRWGAAGEPLESVPGWPAPRHKRAVTEPLQSRYSTWLASTLPSSTPHWSKELMPHTAPCHKRVVTEPLQSRYRAVTEPKGADNAPAPPPPAYAQAHTQLRIRDCPAGCASRLRCVAPPQRTAHRCAREPLAGLESRERAAGEPRESRWRAVTCTAVRCS